MSLIIYFHVPRGVWCQNLLFIFFKVIGGIFFHILIVNIIKIPHHITFVPWFDKKPPAYWGTYLSPTNSNLFIVSFFKICKEQVYSQFLLQLYIQDCPTQCELYIQDCPTQCELDCFRKRKKVRKEFFSNIHEKVQLYFFTKILE